MNMSAKMSFDADVEDFNENPFHRDTKVMIFSSGTEFDDWARRNCDKCLRRNAFFDSACPMYDAMMHSTDDYYCRIPLYLAKMIGIKYDPLYQQGQVGLSCREFYDGQQPF